MTVDAIVSRDLRSAGGFYARRTELMPGWPRDGELGILGAIIIPTWKGEVRVRMVHGHRMGILRRMVRDLCKAHPHMAKYDAGGPAEGETGATIIEWKEN